MNGKNSVAITFPKSERKFQNKNNTNIIFYDVSDKFISTYKQNPCFTLRQRIQLKKKNQIPGPGQYNLIYTSSKGYCFPKNQKNIINKNIIPGPGSYQNPKTRCNSFKFGSQKKILYNVDFKDEILFYKPNKFQQQYYPGPGNYDPKFLNKNQIQIKFTKQKRNMKENNNNPGPGTFRPQKQYSKTGFKFGKEIKNRNKVDHNIGPGQYNIKSTISMLPVYQQVQQ